MTDRDYFAHPTALVEAERVGSNTRIWAFCNVQRGAVIGSDCNICDGCFIEENVVIGDRVTVKNGVSLWDGTVVEDDVFIGPNAVFTNDVYPRSRVHHDEPERTLIKEGATIGAGAVVVAGHSVGRHAFVGAGAVVTKNVPDFTMWYGNPAVFVDYVCKCTRRLSFRHGEHQTRCVCGLSYSLVDGRAVLG